MDNYFEIRGKEVFIFLKRRDGVNLETVISIEDLEKVKSFPGKWYATTKKNLDGYYVNGIYKGTNKTIYLHRFVLNAPKGFHVDHINHDTLNNTRVNLRIATPAQNHQNRGSHKRNTSGTRGVIWNKQSSKWKADVRVGGVRKFERFFENKEDAIEAVMKARAVYMPFSKEATLRFSNYTEEDLLNEYVPYQHHKKKSNRKSKSGYLGVYWHNSHLRWTVYDLSNKPKKFIGSFKDKQDAINAVNKVYENHS